MRFFGVLFEKYDGNTVEMYLTTLGEIRFAKYFVRRRRTYFKCISMYFLYPIFSFFSNTK